MGDQSYRAGAGAIEASSKIVDQTRAELRGKLGQLQGQMEQVKAHWDGQGSTAFQNVQTAWTAQAKDVVDVLDLFQQQLLKNQAQYTSDDEAAKSRLPKYASQMGA